MDNWFVNVRGRRLPSVSVGDVIRLHDGTRYLVKPFGFAKL